MPLLRDTPLKGLKLDFQASVKKETPHEKQISNRVKMDTREFKSIGDMIKHVQNKILKSDGSELAVKKKLESNINSSIRNKHPKCPACGKNCFPVLDEAKSTKTHIIWTNLLKCKNCGKTYEREDTK